MNSMCRLCLCKSQECVSLLENNGNEIVESLTSIKIQKEDSLPLGACINCWQNIKLAYRIQQDILECDKKLRLIDCSKSHENDQLLNLNTKSTLQKSENFSDDQDITAYAIIKNEDEFNEINQESDFFTIISTKPFIAKCSICDEITEKWEISDHVKNHFSQPQNCETCNMKFENINSLQNHKINAHGLNSEQTFQCNECDCCFKYESFYKMHVEKVHAFKRRKSQENIESKQEPVIKISVNGTKPKRNVLKCDSCSAEYHTKWGLKNHALVKHGICLELETEFPLPKFKECPFCPRLFRSDAYQAHLKSHKGPAVCHICGLLLKHSDSLRRHLRVKHSSIKITVKCGICDKIFSSNRSRELHMDRYHNGKAKHICDVCGKNFYLKSGLLKHVQMTHMKLRPFACDYCDKSFYSKFLLKAHLRQHTNDTPFECDECGEAFKHNVSLKTHKKSKHNIEEEKKVCCNICGKGFATEMAVSCHMKKHK